MYFYYMPVQHYFQLKKDLLFRYLHDKRVEGVEASSDKAVIVSHVLTLWESSSSASAAASALADGLSLPCTEEDSLPEAPAPSRNTSYTSLCSLDLYHVNGAVNGRAGGGSNGPPSLGLILNRTSSSSNLHEDSSNFLAPSSAACASAAGARGSASSLLALKRSESNLSFMDDHEASSDGLTMGTTSIVVNGDTQVQSANGIGKTILIAL